MGEVAWLTLRGGEEKDGTEEDGISVAGRQVGVSTGLGIEGTVRGPPGPENYLANGIFLALFLTKKALFWKV